MKQTKKITLSAMMTALGVSLMALGVLVQVLDLTVAALTSLLVAFVYIEVGAPYVHLVWITTSLITFLFFPAQPIWLEYFLVFGIYPILKGYIERAPRKFWFILKFALANAMIALVLLLSSFIFGVSVTETTLFGFINGAWAVAIMWVIMLIAGIAYDMFITVMVRIYFMKFRERFKKFLK